MFFYLNLFIRFSGEWISPQYQTRKSDQMVKRLSCSSLSQDHHSLNSCRFIQIFCFFWTTGNQTTQSSMPNWKQILRNFLLRSSVMSPFVIQVFDYVAVSWSPSSYKRYANRTRLLRPAGLSGLTGLSGPTRLSGPTGLCGRALSHMLFDIPWSDCVLCLQKGDKKPSQETWMQGCFAVTQLKSGYACCKQMYKRLLQYLHLVVRHVLKWI